MRLILESCSGIGHAPVEAECGLGEKIDVDEEYLLGLQNDLVKQIIAADGLLPRKMGKQMAEAWCDSFVNGRCKRRMLGLGACVEK